MQNGNRDLYVNKNKFGRIKLCCADENYDYMPANEFSDSNFN